MGTRRLWRDADREEREWRKNGASERVNRDRDRKNRAGMPFNPEMTKKDGEACPLALRASENGR
jgi:hypothetical protein